MNWLNSCDAVIAEVTAPSLGVGYEIGMAESTGKPILCLFRSDKGARLSAMLSGNSAVKVFNYAALTEAKAAITEFISGLSAGV
jgi:nucleoside 2-deoxyribosyltransferase